MGLRGGDLSRILLSLGGLGETWTRGLHPRTTARAHLSLSPVPRHLPHLPKPALLRLTAARCPHHPVPALPMHKCPSTADTLCHLSNTCFSPSSEAPSFSSHSEGTCHPHLGPARQRDPAPFSLPNLISVPTARTTAPPERSLVHALWEPVHLPCPYRSPLQGQSPDWPSPHLGPCQCPSVNAGNAPDPHFTGGFLTPLLSLTLRVVTWYFLIVCLYFLICPSLYYWKGTMGAAPLCHSLGSIPKTQKSTRKMWDNKCGLNELIFSNIFRIFRNCNHYQIKGHESHWYILKFSYPKLVWWTLYHIWIIKNIIESNQG